MHSLLAWLGIGLVVLGLVGALVPRWPCYTWEAVLFGLALLVLALTLFAHAHRPCRTPAAPPEGSVAFALAFEPLDERTCRPGPANERIARWLADNAHKLSQIYTQEAVVWALEADAAACKYVPSLRPGGALAGRLNGVPVLRMHRHVPGANVRSLESLSLALGRLGPCPPPVLVLVAHEKQYERAHSDLRSLYPGRIVGPCLTNVPYRDRKWHRPMAWACRELLIARPLEAVQRTVFPPHPGVTLSPGPEGPPTSGGQP
jgi:hypothetical protein